MVLDMFQKEEQDRINQLRNLFLIYMEKDAGLNVARGEKTAAYTEAVKKISAETEVGRIISDMRTTENSVEDIPFKKMSSRSEAILQKFDSYCAKGGPMSAFNFESARLSASTGVDEDMDEKTQEITSAMKKILNHCWDAKDPSALDHEKFKEYIKDKKGRKIFGECMNQYRKQGIFSMSPHAYSAVAELIYYIISQIEKEEDIDCALSVIILSQTFYCDQKNPEGGVDRVYLQQSILKHPYWKNEEVWVRALEVPLDTGESASDHADESEEERLFREANEAFVKLGTYAHNMVQFEVDRKVVEKVIFGYAANKQLSKQYVDAIKVPAHSYPRSKPSRSRPAASRRRLLPIRNSWRGSRLYSRWSRFACG